MELREVNYFLRRVRHRWDFIFSYCGIRDVDYDNLTIDVVKEVESLRHADKELEMLWVRLEEAQADYRKAVKQYQQAVK